MRALARLQRLRPSSFGHATLHRRAASGMPVPAYDPEKPYPIWFFDPDGSCYHAALGVARASSSVLEHLHVFTGLPWWSTIAVGSLLIRIAFFPINCYSLRNASRFFDAKPDVQSLQRSHRAALLALVGVLLVADPWSPSPI